MKALFASVSGHPERGQNDKLPRAFGSIRPHKVEPSGDF